MKIIFTLIMSVYSLLAPDRGYSCGCPYGGTTFKETFLNYCGYVARLQSWEEDANSNHPHTASQVSDPDFMIFSRDQIYLMADEYGFTFPNAFSLTSQVFEAGQVKAKRPKQGICTTLQPQPIAKHISITFVDRLVSNLPYVTCGVNYLDLIAYGFDGNIGVVTDHNWTSTTYGYQVQFENRTENFPEDKVYVIGSIDKFAQPPMPLTEFKSKLSGWTDACREIIETTLR